MYKRKHRVVLAGADASGKTSVSRLLYLYFKKKGRKPVIVRIRGTHSIAYIAYRFLSKFRTFRGEGLHYYNFKLPEKIKSFWLIIELLSVILKMFIHYYAYFIFYNVVISERGPLDFFIWVITGIKPNFNSRITRIFFRLALTWVLYFNTIYIRADIATLIQRKPVEKKLIKDTFPLYETLARLLNLKKLDTTESTLSVTTKNLLLDLQVLHITRKYGRNIHKFR